MAENNIANAARCQSTKPPYADPHVRWCGRSKRELILFFLPDFAIYAEAVFSVMRAYWAAASLQQANPHEGWSAAVLRQINPHRE
jgi:hypothetical protein